LCQIRGNSSGPLAIVSRMPMKGIAQGQRKPAPSRGIEAHASSDPRTGATTAMRLSAVDRQTTAHLVEIDA
jgi:hypothetical protein